MQCFKLAAGCFGLLLTCQGLPHVHLKDGSSLPVDLQLCGLQAECLATNSDARYLMWEAETVGD